MTDFKKQGKTNRSKGNSYERETALALRKYFPRARRGLQDRSGTEACDVENTPMWIECKDYKRVNVHKFYTQACEDSDGRTPIVIHKYRNEKGRVKHLVTLERDTFLDLAFKEVEET